MTGRESVVLAGANQLLLIGIKQVVEATDRFEVVSQAHASELALTLARQLKPDYVILDETERRHKTIEGAGVMDTLHGLGKLSKQPGVLAVVAPDQFRLVEELRRAGCRACVSTRSADTVVTALDMVSLGREFFPEWRNSRRQERARGNSGASSLLKDLNRSEVEILALMARGYSSKEVAARLVSGGGHRQELPREHQGEARRGHPQRDPAGRTHCGPARVSLAGTGMSALRAVVSPPGVGCVFPARWLLVLHDDRDGWSRRCAGR